MTDLDEAAVTSFTGLDNPALDQLPISFHHCVKQLVFQIRNPASNRHVCIIDRIRQPDYGCLGNSQGSRSAPKDEYSVDNG